MKNKFDIILADPPWSYRVWSGKRSRTADSQYKVLGKYEIAQFPVREIAAENSVLHLWATMPCLPEAFAAMAAWGFVYKTVSFAWVKINKDGTTCTGLGHHTRGNVELVLLGIRGKGLPRERRDISQVIHAPHRKIVKSSKTHSVKPYEVQERIEQLYGHGYNRAELFARQERRGWICWGDEIEDCPVLFGEEEDRRLMQLGK